MTRRNRQLSLQAVQLLAAMLDDPTAEYWGSQLGDKLGLLSGTVYPLLRRLEDRGLLVSRMESIDMTVEARPRRRLYRLTGDGETVARHEVARVFDSLAPARPHLGLT